jgi:long-chain fatty acid transport protein
MEHQNNVLLHEKTFNEAVAYIIVFIILLIFPESSFAGGPVHGAKAAGMNTAFIAVADDLSAILHNPAGLTQSKGTNVYGGVSLLFPETKYESPAGESEETEFQVFYPPHLYISSDFGKEDLVFGLGIYSPFGIGGREWSESGLTRFLSVESFTGTISVNPTAAWQILPNISVAAGIDYMRAQSKAQSMLLPAWYGSVDAKMEMETEGDGWGYNLGALIFIDDTLRLGLAYRSRIRVDADGELVVKNAPALQPSTGSSRFETDVNTTSTFPEIYSIGIAYLPDKKLVIDFDVEWVRWSSFKRLDIDLEDEVAPAVVDIPIPLEWKDSWQYKLGMEYMLTGNLSLRGGYAFINTPVPDHTLSPANPDSDQHSFSIGGGYGINKWTIDFFYIYSYFEDRNVNNDILSGEYENFMHYAGLSTGYSF